MGIFDKNKGKVGRKPNLWVRYWVNGEEIREPGKGGRKATAAYEVELKRQIKAGTWIHPRLRRDNRARFDEYARSVVLKRAARGVGASETPPNKTERGHVENHLIPTFGKFEVRELTFKRIKDGFDKEINNKGLSGRMVRNVHSTLRAILVEAVEDELIDNPPISLSVKRDHLPPPVDKDPEWREDAYFELDEIPVLLGVDMVSLRRVMYATYFLTGSRFREVAALKVRDYNRTMGPLRCLSIPAAKTGRHRSPRRRHVPVHPELQRWLDWWLTHEYEILYGAKPKPEDLLFPTVSVRRRNRGLMNCSHNEIFKQWQRHDLPAAGLRHRRLHDARRTFISALRSKGVPDPMLRKLTHWSVEDRVLDAYTSWDWEALCQQVERVTWGLPKPSAAPREEAAVIDIQSGTRRDPVFAADRQTP